jgi:acid phosphatase (class A)
MKFWNKQLVLLSVALALGFSACSSPTAKIALKRAHLISQRTYYVPAEQFKTAPFTPPPAFESEAQKADLAITLDWQKKRTEADCAKAKVTAEATYDSFWGGKSPFPQPLPAEVKDFFDRLTLDLDSAVTEMKDRYARPRPFKAYPGVAEPCIKRSGGYSYPSGHATFSRVFADVLADIVPERQAGFFAKADEIAQDRVIGGVHFASDIAAGKAFADQYHAELLKSPAYLKDIEKMKALLVK